MSALRLPTLRIFVVLVACNLFLECWCFSVGLLEGTTFKTYSMAVRLQNVLGVIFNTVTLMRDGQKPKIRISLA